MGEAPVLAHPGPSPEIESRHDPSQDQALIRRILHRLLGDDASVTTLIRGAAGVFAVRVTGIALGFVVHLTVARALGVSEYGVFSVAIAWVFAAGVLCRAGIDTVSLRFIPQLLMEEEKARDDLSRYLSWSSSVPYLAALVVAAVGGGSAYLLIDDAPWIAIAAAALPAHVATIIWASHLRAARHAAQAEIGTSIFYPFTLLVVFELISITQPFHSTGRDALLAFLLAWAITAWVMRFLALRRFSPVQLHSQLVGEPTWREAALFLAISSGSTFLIGQLGVMVLGAIQGTTEAGLYAVAVKVGALASLGLMSVNAILAPTIARLYVQNDRTSLQRELTVSARLGTLFAMGVAVVVVFAGDLILGLFGPGFDAAYGALIIIVAGRVVDAFAGSVGYYLSMAKGHRLLASVNGATLALNLALNLALIPSYGIEGAAVATALTTTVWNLILVRHIKRRDGLTTNALPTAKP